MGITAKELARLLGLSQTAVSFALNNKPGVSAETRRLVIAEATKHGYDFSRVRSRRQRTDRICLLTGPHYHTVREGDNNFDDIIAGARQECRQHGCRMEVMSLDASQLGGEGLSLTMMDLRQKDVDGILVLGADVPKLVIAELRGLDVPIVLIDAYYQDLSISAVTVDNRTGGRIAAAYLCDTYLQEPWYLRSRYRTVGFDERINGFMESVRDHAYSRRKVKVLNLTPTAEGAEQDLLTHLAEGPTMPRSLFAETDLMAMGAMRAFSSLGLHAPEDIAIVGFGNLPLARKLEVPLTTVDYPKAYMGIEAARRLLGLIDYPTEYVTNTQVAVTLVRRQSA